jgi:hypothetical protein
MIPTVFKSLLWLAYLAAWWSGQAICSPSSSSKLAVPKRVSTVRPNLATLAKRA